MLEFHQITKSFPSPQTQLGLVVALNEISFAVGKNDFVALVGPSGCGKSTLLRLAAGLEKPDVGRVTFEGKLVESPSAERVLMFQSDTCFPWLKVRENALFAVQSRNPQARAEARKLGEELLAKVGLFDFADAYPHQLSGGMRQRLALARSLVVRPKLLLLDEPFGSVDVQTRAQLQDLLRVVITEANTSVMLVTHDVEEAILLANRILVVSQRPGTILQEIAGGLLDSSPSDRDRHTLEFQSMRAQITNLLGCTPG